MDSDFYAPGERGVPGELLNSSLLLISIGRIICMPLTKCFTLETAFLFILLFFSNIILREKSCYASKDTFISRRNETLYRLIPFHPANDFKSDNPILHLRLSKLLFLLLLSAKNSNHLLRRRIPSADLDTCCLFYTCLFFFFFFWKWLHQRGNQFCCFVKTSFSFPKRKKKIMHMHNRHFQYFYWKNEV